MNAEAEIMAGPYELVKGADGEESDYDHVTLSLLGDMSQNRKQFNRYGELVSETNTNVGKNDFE